MQLGVTSSSRSSEVIMSLTIKLADGMHFLPLLGKASDSPEIQAGLILTSIRFTSSKISDYTQYAEKLPFGIAFDQNQADVHALLGPPPEKHRFLHTERRTIDGVHFHIGYDESYQLIEECRLASPLWAIAMGIP